MARSFAVAMAAFLAVFGILASASALAQTGRLFQLSTRAQVLTGDDVMIAGLIVSGPSPKTVVINVAGPSLANRVALPLRDPTLTLVRSDGVILKTNDNWQVQDIASDAAAIAATGFQPSDPREPAIIATLPTGAYTAIVRGAGNTTGVAVVQAFEVDHPDVPLINISTRARVLTGENVMIAGFAVGPSDPRTVVINVTGPSLVGHVQDPLQNPALALVRMSDGVVIASNDDWQVQSNPADVAALQASGFAPAHPREAAIIATLPPGLYTAIASGVGTPNTGVALISVFQASRDLAISSANTTTFTVGAAGTFTVATEGNPAATSVTATGALPAGVTFTPGTTTATLSGTPAAGTGGTYPLTITAANGSSPNATQAFTLVVNQAPAITSANAATFNVGTAGTHTVVATGFPAPTLSMTGALPTGVTFNTATGVLSGTPAAGSAGSYPITITAANGVGSNATQSFTLTVIQTVAITSANAATFTVGTAGTFTITTSAVPTATSITAPGLPAGLTLSATSGTGTATISGTPTGPSGVFTITITASNGGVSPDGTQTFTLTVLAQAQTISFTSVAPASPVANGPTYNVTATATSGLTVALTIDASAAGVCTIAGSTVSFIAGGTCVINANQAGNGSYLAAPQVQQSMVVAKATQTVTITSPAPGAAVVAGPTYNVVANAAPSGLPVTFGTSTPAVCTAAGSTISFIGAGTCTVVASQAGNATYDPAQATQSFAVGKASQTITFTSVAPASATVGGATYGVTATATSGLAVAFTIDPAAAAVCSIAGSTVSFIGAGNCIVNANQAGNANYNAAPQVQQTFAVKSSQTITFTSPLPTNAAVGGPTYTPTATATSGLTVAISIDPSAAAVCSIAGGVVTFNTVGTCVINANQAGNASYFAAPQVQQSFAVRQVPAITSGSNTTFNVGTPGTFTVTTTGFPTPALGASGALPGNVTFVDNGNGTATLAGTPAAGSAAGSPYALTITAANGVTPNATQSFTLTVTDTAVAVADAYSVVHDSGVNAMAPSLLANDLGTPTPTVSSVTGLTTCNVFPCTVATTHGSITVQSNGGFTYTPTAAYAGPDSFTYTATNSGGTSVPATVTITVTNVLPVVDLDGALTGGINSAANFTEGGGPVSIVGTVNPDWLTLADSDHTALSSATIVLTNALDGPSEILALTCPGLPAPPACSGAIQTTDIVSAAAPGTYTITITKVAPLADYEALLRSLTYNNASVTPNVTQRDVTVTVNDGIANSSPVAHALVTIAGVNNAPVLAAIEGGALAYSVGGPPTAVTSSVTVSDADSANLASATVQITANCNSADDVLAFTTQNGISGVYTAATCLMALTGSASPANYQAALRSVTYQNTNQATTVLTRTVSFQVNDGAGANNLSNIVTRNVTVAVNTAPVLTAGGTLNYTENQAPTAIDNTITVVDTDSPNLASATAQITGNCQSAEDVLTFTTQNGISGVYTAGTCLMTLTGSASPANYQIALRSLQYSNSSENPNTTARTVTWRVNDGGVVNNLSNTPTSTINVAATNDAPVLVAGGVASFTENGPAAVLDGALTVTDADSANLASATVQITANCTPGEDVLAFVNGGGITGVYTAATCTMALTGSATVAAYQSALRSITYANTSENPVVNTRTVTWIANDGTTASTPVTSTVNVTAVNDAPVLALVGSLSYTENQAAASLITSATITDVDSTNMTGATVQITGNYVNGQDVLSYAAALGITGSFNPATGTLTLTGTTTIANYQAALANVKYANTSENPSTALRTVTWQVNDGGAVSNLSNQPTSTITVTSVNDPPVANGFTNLPAQAGIPITYPAGKLGGTDPEGSAVTIATTPDSLCAGCLLTINTDGSFTFTPPPFSGGTTVQFTYHVTDVGVPGPGNANSAPAIVSFSVVGPAIHFVKSVAVPPGNCTLGAECTLATADTNIGATTGAVIFISDANSHTVSATLPANTQVYGQGVVTGQTFDQFFGIGAPAQGTLATRPLLNQGRPTLTSAGTTLTVGSGSTLRGFNFGNATTALSGTGFGTLTLSDMLFNTNGQAMSLTNGTLNASLDSVTSTGGATNLSLTTVAGTVILGSGALSGATGNAFDVSGGTADITYNGTIASGSGRSVSVANKTGGTVVFNGAVTDTDTGISLTSNTGAAIAFTGGLTLATTTNAAFTATGGGTVTATGTNTITTTTGTAVNVASTTIGAANLNFRSITAGTGASGPANAIILNNTGTSGGFIVTGNAGTCTVATPTCTGGQIQRTTGDAILLTNTQKVSLAFMNIHHNLGSGIRGTSVNGFVLDRMLITDNGDSAATDDSGIDIIGLFGTDSAGTHPTSITNSTIQNNFEFELQITNPGSSALTDLVMSGNTISSNGLQLNHGNLVNFLSLGTGAMKLSVTSGTFTGNTDTSGGKVVTGTGVQCDHSGSAGLMTCNISGATFTNNNVGPQASVAVGGQVLLDFNGNTITGTRSHGINLFADANPPFTKSLSGRIRNNIVGTNGVVNSGSQLGPGIRLQNEGSVPVTLVIENNTVQETQSFQGINVNVGISIGAALGGAATNLTIVGNSFNDIGSRAIVVQDNDVSTSTKPTICVDMRANNFGPGIAGQAGDLSWVRLRELSGTFNVRQAAPTTAANGAELDDQQVNGNDATGTKYAISGTPQFGQPACAQPPN